MHGFFPSSFAVKTIQITKMLNITSEDDTWNWVGRTVWHPGGRVEKVDANAHATISCSMCLWAHVVDCSELACSGIDFVRFWKSTPPWEMNSCL